MECHPDWFSSSLEGELNEFQAGSSSSLAGGWGVIHIGFSFPLREGCNVIQTGSSFLPGRIYLKILI
jgi:hypothetical protein